MGSVDRRASLESRGCNGVFLNYILIFLYVWLWLVDARGSDGATNWCVRRARPPTVGIEIEFSPNLAKDEAWTRHAGMRETEHLDFHSLPLSQFFRIRMILSLWDVNSYSCSFSSPAFTRAIEDRRWRDDE